MATETDRLLGRIWDRCAVCDKPVALMDGRWYHAGPADHAASSVAVMLGNYDALLVE